MWFLRMPSKDVDRLLHGDEVSRRNGVIPSTTTTRYLVTTFLVITSDQYNFKISVNKKIKAESLLCKMSTVFITNSLDIIIDK